MKTRHRRIKELIEQANDSERMQKVCELARKDERRKVDDEWLKALDKHFKEYIPKFEDAINMVKEGEGLSNPDKLIKYIKNKIKEKEE